MADDAILGAAMALAHAAEDRLMGIGSRRELQEAVNDFWRAVESARPMNQSGSITQVGFNQHKERYKPTLEQRELVSGLPVPVYNGENAYEDPHEEAGS